MNIIDNYNEQTLLRNWWRVVKINFNTTSDNINSLNDNVETIMGYIGDMSVISNEPLAESINNINKTSDELLEAISAQELNLANNYYTKSQIDSEIGVINSALEAELNGNSVE